MKFSIEALLNKARLDPSLLDPEQINILQEAGLLIKKSGRWMVKMASDDENSLLKVAKLLNKGQTIQLDSGKHKVICEDDEYAVLAPVSGKRTKISESVVYSNLDEHADQIKVIKADNVTRGGKIPAIEVALPDPVERKVATMMATSHEYKDKPNVGGALALVKNYSWKIKDVNPNKLQGIDKDTRPEAVESIVKSLKNGKEMPPLIVVDQLHGINPQNNGKLILLDGHHRHQGQLAEGLKSIKVYHGKYTGGSQKSEAELRTAQTE